MKSTIVVRIMDLVVNGRVIVMMMMNVLRDSFVGTATVVPGFMMELIVAQESRVTIEKLYQCYVTTTYLLPKTIPITIPTRIAQTMPIHQMYVNVQCNYEDWIM